MDDPAPLARHQLVGHLGHLNEALARMGAVPLVTVEEAEALPDDNLRGVVLLTADRIVEVLRATKGTL